jgi:endogenous inhibitor of DNA gyrase (YacG/DUF329 family)
MAAVRRKVLFRTAITALAVLAFAILTAHVSGAFVAGIMLSVVIGAIALLAISCPKCGHTVLLQKQSAFGHSFRTFTPFPLPTVCANCGEALERNDDGPAT